MPKASMLLLKSCVSINPLDAASSIEKNKMNVPVYVGEETSHFSDWPASSNLPSQVQTTEDILLIGSVSIVATSTLLDALNAIDAVSPGCLLSPALPPDETPPCYCLSL